MDINELRRQIDSGEFSLTSNPEVIEKGTLGCRGGLEHNYRITHGWDILSSHQCNIQWNEFNMRLFEKIEKSDYTDEYRHEVLSSIKKEDHHWDWFYKSKIYSGEEYEWFYMFINDKPQGACLFYHPKNSIIDKKNIFYIEFVAVAPWNRNSAIHKRDFKGIGTILIKRALDYAVNTLDLSYGFSLHSLPQSAKYYKRIGMENYPERDKASLLYFEMPREGSKQLMGEV